MLLLFCCWDEPPFRLDEEETLEEDEEDDGLLVEWWSLEGSLRDGEVVDELELLLVFPLPPPIHGLMWFRDTCSGRHCMVRFRGLLRTF